MVMKGPTQSDQVGRAIEQKDTYIITVPLPLLGPLIHVQITRTLVILLHGERFVLSTWTSPAYRGALAGKRQPTLWSS